MRVKPQQSPSPLMAQADRLAPLVLHVFPGFDMGGAQMRFVALANHFGKAFRHMVIALDGATGCRERLAPDLDISFPRVIAPKHAMLTNAWRFHALLRSLRPDVLVTCNWGAIEFALANLLPVTRHIHVVDGFGPEERTTQIPRRIMIRRFALARGTVVLPSRTLVRIATEQWKLRPGTVRYVPNGIDLARFAEPPIRGTGEPVIGTVAALRPEKNLARLLRAFARVVTQRPARLVIVGDGVERPALAELARSLGVADRVTFTGQRQDTPTLYAGFDVFALSSDTEQMPLSVIEAMASGLPIVSTDVGDLRSMVSEANAPFVTPLCEPALAVALLSLLREPELRAQLGEANQAKARRDFDQAAMFAAWHALWQGSAGPA